MAKAPEPVEAWQPTIRDALEHSPVCMQPETMFEIPFPQSENCLTLNIYVPGAFFL